MRISSTRRSQPHHAIIKVISYIIRDFEGQNDKSWTFKHFEIHWRTKVALNNVPNSMHFSYFDNDPIRELWDRPLRLYL